MIFDFLSDICNAYTVSITHILKVSHFDGVFRKTFLLTETINSVLLTIYWVEVISNSWFQYNERTSWRTWAENFLQKKIQINFKKHFVSPSMNFKWQFWIRKKNMKNLNSLLDLTLKMSLSQENIPWLVYIHV